MTELSNRSLVALALAPIVIVEACFLPMYCFHGFVANHTGLLQLQMAFSVVFLPFYIAAFGIWRLLSGDRWTVAAFVVAAAMLPLALEYAMCGISSGHFWSPDYESRDLFSAFSSFAACAATIPLACVLLGRAILRLVAKGAAAS